MEGVYCLVVDILGFKNLAEATDGTYQAATVDDWLALVDAAAAEHSIDRFQLISDSLFAVAPATNDGLSHILAFGRSLLERGAAQKILLRGAVSSGGVRWSDRMAHGPAIIDAYLLGESTNWIGISCTFAFPELDSMWGQSVVAYVVPRKVRDLTTRPALVWTIPDDDALLRAAVPRDVGSRSRPKLSKPVAAKLRGTGEFRDYLARLKARPTADPKRFHRVP